MSDNTTTHLTKQAKIIPFIRTSQITRALLQLRQELEEISPLDKQIRYADELLYDVCVALDLPVLEINLILGKDHNPYDERIGG